jgi:hypothetical protein
MRTLSPKTLLAVLNLSPVFEAVAIFAERLVLNGDKSKAGEIDGRTTLPSPSGEYK